MSEYQIEVKVYDHNLKRYAWKALKPSQGPPYVFESKAEAIRMRGICYPMQDDSQVRVSLISEAQRVKEEGRY